MIRIGCLLIAFLALFPSTVAAQDDEPCRSALLEYSAGNYETALEMWDLCLESETPYSAAYLLRGSTHLELRDIDAALADFQSYVDASPENYAAYYEVADFLEDDNLYLYAIDFINIALDLNPECAECYYVRARSNFEAERFEDAIKDYTSTIELDPEYPDYVYYNRGSANYNLQQYEKAIADYSQHIEVFPDDAAGYRKRGDSYWLLNEKEKAIEDYYAFQERNGGKLTQLMQDRIDEQNNPFNGIPPLVFLGGFVLAAAYLMWRARYEDKKAQ